LEALALDRMTRDGIRADLTRSAPMRIGKKEIYARPPARLPCTARRVD
jgi:hypothetical protein